MSFGRVKLSTRGKDDSGQACHEQLCLIEWKVFLLQIPPRLGIRGFWESICSSRSVGTEKWLELKNVSLHQWVYFGSYFPVKLKLKIKNCFWINSFKEWLENWIEQIRTIWTKHLSTMKFPPNMWELSGLHCFCFLLAHSWQYLTPGVLN